MEKYYYLILNVASFSIPFIFSFEKRWMHFIRFWKPYFLSLLIVGIFFIAWDIYFTYREVWGFNDKYLIGYRIARLPIEEWFFFILIPYASNFIHYAIGYFLPYVQLTKSTTQYISISLLLISLLILFFHLNKIYTVCCLGLFAILLLLQCIYQWRPARQFYISFIAIFIPFYLVNSALTGSFTPQAVVYYNNTQNMNIKLGTIPLEDVFYCFTLLYTSVLVFEYSRKNGTIAVN